MLFYILLAITAALAALAWVVIHNDIYSEWFARWIGSTGAALLILVMGGLVSWGVSMGTAALLTDSHSEQYGSWGLQQITTGSSTKGAFFLGTGYVEGSQQYMFYYKSDGGYRMTTVDADDALVLETTDKPHAVQNVHYFSGWFMPKHFLQADNAVSYDWVIYVPKGSVRQVTDMNLQGVGK